MPTLAVATDQLCRREQHQPCRQKIRQSCQPRIRHNLAQAGTTVSATTTLTSDRSTPAVDASTGFSSDDVDRTGDVLPQPTAGGSPECVFADTDAPFDDSLAVPTDIWRRTMETDGHVGDRRCAAERGGRLRPARPCRRSWTAGRRRRRRV